MNSPVVSVSFPGSAWECLHPQLRFGQTTETSPAKTTSLPIPPDIRIRCMDVIQDGSGLSDRELFNGLTTTMALIPLLQRYSTPHSGEQSSPPSPDDSTMNT